MNYLYKYITPYIFLIVIFQACIEVQDDVNIPEHAEDLDELTIFHGSDQLSNDIDFQKTQVYGDTEEVTIGGLWTFDVDESAQVYIADSQELDIKVFSPEGELLSRLGKEGSGPGEFREISSIQTSAGYLSVFDRSRQKLFTFNTDDGRYVKEVGVAGNRDDVEELQDAHINDFFVTEDNTFLFEFSRTRVPENASSWDYFSGTRMFYRIDTEGDIVSDELLETKSSYQVLVPMGGRIIGTPVDFFGKPLVEVSPDGTIYVAWTEDFLVKQYSSNGEYQRAFYHPIKHIEFLPEYSFDGADEAFLEEAKRSIDFPSNRPVLNDLLVDDENRLWVSTIVDDFDIYEWWVLEENGELITKFEWPRDEPIEVVQNGEMYTRETDEETGLQQVIRYRIEMEETERE